MSIKSDRSQPRIEPIGITAIRFSSWLQRGDAR